MALTPDQQSQIAVTYESAANDESFSRLNAWQTRSNSTTRLWRRSRPLLSEPAKAFRANRRGLRGPAQEAQAADGAEGCA
jgi:uncharacterized protein (DUF3084 family)